MRQVQLCVPVPQFANRIAEYASGFQLPGTVAVGILDHEFAAAVTVEQTVVDG